MEKKNIFEKNKFDKKKLGYYVLLSLCVAVIGAVSFISYKSIQKSLSNQPIDNLPDNVDKVDTTLENVIETEKTEQNEINVEENKEEVVKPEADAKPVIDSKPYIMPVSGQISTAFSLTTPVYSETLKDWRIHDGVDIAANLGDNVVAINDGAVEKIEANDLFGITVVIKHTDGKKSIYCNLDDNVELEEGQIINQGDIVGKIGNTAVFEIADGPHLHLEITENGKKIDPTTVIKVQE